jgi:XRE family transcriptional regulator, master regulator for biofilm formation
MSPQRLSVVITKFREGQGLTQRDLAKKAKVTAAYVAMIETGVRKNPSLAILKRLAKALGVPVTALLE